MYKDKKKFDAMNLLYLASCCCNVVINYLVVLFKGESECIIELNEWKKGSKLVSIFIVRWRENVIICWENMGNNNKTKKKEYDLHSLPYVIINEKIIIYKTRHIVEILILKWNLVHSLAYYINLNKCWYHDDLNYGKIISKRVWYAA